MWKSGKLASNKGFEKGKLDKAALKTVAGDTAELLK
jgi:hypothetical protein